MIAAEVLMDINEEADAILENEAEDEALKLKAEARAGILRQKLEALQKPYEQALKQNMWREAHDLLRDIYETNLAEIRARDCRIVVDGEIDLGL
jgi:hypothetical protein